MSWEIYTFGGGDYLYDVFNGIAALTTGRSYLNIVASIAMLGLMWAMLQSSFGNGYKANITWIVSFMLFYNVMFVPKSTVMIHDSLNKDSQYEVIENVPFALAAFASLSSQIGKSLTENMEMAFSAPDYLPYHKHGMLFGSKLIGMTTSMKIVDEDFASSINSFMKQCVFYDLLLHRYTLDDLKKTNNIWNFLTNEVHASKARSFLLIDNNKQSIITCEEGVKYLNDKWVNQINGIVEIFGKQIFNQQNAKNLFMQYLPISYNSLKATSKEATDIIKQNLLINAIDRASVEFGSLGASSNVYTSVRANVQTKAAFNASKRQAEEWVPILRIVFEILFYGAFPMVFLLFLLPIGPQVAQGYFAAFVWLQSWGPLYAILNLIMSGYVNTKTAAINDYGLSIMTQSGIAAVHHDASEIAGYIAWFIPFIAAGIARGAHAVTGLSTSILAIPQSAANTAASEAASGNISLGNVNLDNASHGNISANKINDSAFFDSARVQAVNYSGGVTTINSDGKAVYDQTGSVSRIPNVQLASNDTQTQSAMQSASIYENMGENVARQASFARSKSIDQLSQYMSTHSMNESNGLRFNEHATAEVREAYNRIEHEASELSKSHNIDKSTAFNMVMNGNVGLGIGGNKGASAGISAGLGGSYDSRDSENHSNSLKFSKTNQLSKDISSVISAIQDRSLDLSDSHGHSLNESFNQNFSEAQRLEDQSRVYHDISKSFTKQAQVMDSQSISFGKDMMPAFVEYAKSYPDISGQPLGERVLSMLASNSTEVQMLKESFIRDKEIGNFNQTFRQTKQNIAGSNNLKTQYENSVESIRDDIGEHNNISARTKFITATESKNIDNKDLKLSAVKTVKDNHTKLQGTSLDGLEIEEQIKDKFKND